MADVEESLRRHVAALSDDIGDRTPLRPEKLARTADYVRAAFEAAGLRVSDQVYDYHGVFVANIIADPPGESSAYYVIGAHYDTVPGTPGADDNASAVAVLLELAARLGRSPPPVPVRLVAFTLEEPPAHTTAHQGSRVFVRRIKGLGHRVLGALVLEMVGYTSPRQDYPMVLHWAGYPARENFIGIVANWRSRRLGRAVLKGFCANPDLPVESLFVPFNGWVLPDTRLSNHASFWDVGWPALMVTDTAYFRNPHYHGPGDRMETLDFSFMAELVKSMELSLSELPGP